MRSKSPNRWKQHGLRPADATELCLMSLADFSPRGTSALGILFSLAHCWFIRIHHFINLRRRSMLRMIVLVAIGWIVGLSARTLLPGKGPDGFWATTGVGVGGAILAVVVGRLAGWWHPGRCSRICPVAARRDHAAGALSRAQDQIHRDSHAPSLDVIAAGLTVGREAQPARAPQARPPFRYRVSCPASSSAGLTLTSTDSRCPACPL